MPARCTSTSWRCTEITRRRQKLDFASRLGWSPDSRRIVTHKYDERNVEKLHLLYDGDKAGRAAVKRALKVLLPTSLEVAVVEVDSETGAVELLRHYAVDDCGRLINPTLARGQVHGGIAQGIGQALLEAAGGTAR